MASRRKTAQTEMEFATWGGKRKRAGRKRATARAHVPHVTRPRFGRWAAFHVTTRVAAEVGKSLRARGPYHAVRRAMAGMARSDFGIVHISLEHDHMHLVAEAENERALAAGMQRFESVTARRFNRAVGRRGRVFEDRYHAVELRSPTQARRAINYVLNNFRRHRLDDGMETRFWEVDYFSSGPTFDGWAEGPLRELPPGYVPLPVARARTWLLRAGWRKAGGISRRGIPGPET